MNNAKQDIKNLISNANESLQNEDYERASKLFSKLNQLMPSNFGIKYNLGGCLAKQNKFKESLSIFLEAKELDERNPDIYYSLGLAFYRLNEEKESIINYKKCLELDPLYMDAWSNLADIYLLKRNYSLCYKLSEIILSHDPNYPKAYMYKGVSLVGLHRYKDSLEYLKKSLEVDVNCYNSKKALGTAKLYLGDINSAVNIIKETDGVFNFFSEDKPYEII